MTPLDSHRTPGSYAAIAVSTAAVFLADLFTPLGITVWVFYLAPVAFCVFVWRPTAPLFVAAICTALITINFFLDPSGVDPWVAQVNRTFGAVTVWLVAVIVNQTIRTKRTVAQQEWVKQGQARLSERMQGDLQLAELGTRLLQELAPGLGAQVGVIYLSDGRGAFVRFGAHAAAGEVLAAPERLQAGAGLTGQVLRDKKLVLLTQVPADYLPITSALGRTTPQTLIIAPATADGEVTAVLELGFLRAVEPAVIALLHAVAEPIGVAVRSAHFRTRQAELLEETQRQAEELQAQQEELRVSNEELEEQSRALKESQARLEAQQAELEQTNSQLEEQAQDLEAQKQALTQSQSLLSHKADELERSNQYKSEFLANMSHELRTPLNSSLILAKLLVDNKDKNLTEEQVKFAQTIYSAGNDLLVLINDILDLSKIESGKVEIVPETVGVASVVESLSKTFAPVAAEKGLTFRAELAPELPRTLQTDGQRLGQILRNLISNALKFTEAGEVVLAVSAVPEGLRFAVRDTGIGIPEHQHQVIFEAFRQADGSTHRKYGGTGLGLSISRDLARLLGGDITVSSVVGQGSTFSVTLPLQFRAPPQTAREPRSATPPPAPRAPLPVRRPAEPRPTANKSLAPSAVKDDRDALRPDSRRMLVVEDDVRFAEILVNLAHELGFQCVATQSGGDALAAALQFQPSAIVLDMNLPDHSGLAVLDQLKRNPVTRHVPVHVVSVADYRQEAMGLGAVGYALKPVKREELVDAFQRLESKLTQSLRRVLVVEDDARQRDSIRQLLQGESTQIDAVASASEALQALQTVTYDVMVMDLGLRDLSGYELLEQMAAKEELSFPPVIVYTGRSLTRDEEQRLRRFSKSIIIKGARSPERLLDEVTLFLHQVEASFPPERRRMLEQARDREAALEGRRILVVEDDVRNIFALSRVLEPKGAKVEIARNGREALEVLTRGLGQAAGAVDLVLMDIMMPEMDGLTAMREIRKRPEWKKLPIIALTAKAMRDDQEKCIAAGANDYIAKPLDVERLLSLVRVWMPKA